MKKKLFFACIAMITVAQVFSQTAADKLFDKYSEKEGFTTVFISKYMFDLFTQIDSKDKDLKEVVNKLNSIKILASDEGDNGGINFYDEIMEFLPQNEYKELMVVKEKNQDLKFLIKETEGHISELLLVVGGDTDNVLISIQGTIDLETISKLSKTMNIQGMENLEKIEK